MLFIRNTIAVLLVIILCEQQGIIDAAKHRRKLCPKAAGDVVFALDSSSMQPYKWSAQRRMTRKVVAMLKFGKKRFRFSLVTFGDKVTQRFSFDRHKNVRMVRMDMSHKMLKNENASDARLDLALQFIRLNSFTEANGHRPNVRKIVVVLLHRDLSNFEEVRRQASLLRDTGAEVVLVTMGVASADGHQHLRKTLVARFHMNNHYTMRSASKNRKKIAMAVCKVTRLNYSPKAKVVFEIPKSPVKILPHGAHMMARMRFGTLESKTKHDLPGDHSFVEDLGDNYDQEGPQNDQAATDQQPDKPRFTINTRKFCDISLDREQVEKIKEILSHCATGLRVHVVFDITTFTRHVRYMRYIMGSIWDNLSVSVSGDGTTKRGGPRYWNNCHFKDEPHKRGIAYDPCYDTFAADNHICSNVTQTKRYKYIPYLIKHSTISILHNSGENSWLKSSVVGPQVLVYVKTTGLAHSIESLRSYLKSFHVLRYDYDIPILPVLIGKRSSTKTIGLKTISSYKGSLLRLRGWASFGIKEVAGKFVKKLARHICKLRPKSH